MDDLNGLDWTAPPKVQKSSTPVYPTLRPSPAPSSGRSTPGAFSQNTLSSSQPSAKVDSRSIPTVNDSFANLLSGTKQKASNNLSLQERQRQILEERAKKSEQLDSQFGGHVYSSVSSNNGIGHGKWNGSSGAQIRPVVSPAALSIRNDDDILAAFNSSAKVDSSSHFPPAHQPISIAQKSSDALGSEKQEHVTKPEDDDPFDLSQFISKPAKKTAVTAANDDGDILGMLGRPVQEVSVAKAQHNVARQDDSASDHDEVPPSISDKAVLELVEMGFTADKAAIALAQTDSGHDVRAAVGILLNRAHDEARQKAQRHAESDPRTEAKRVGRITDGRSAATPSWKTPQNDNSRSSSQARSQGGNDKDVAKMASDIGNSLFKSANSLWKTSQKKVQKAMADFQQEGGDSSQPKWMRDAQASQRAGSEISTNVKARNVTDEAAMLESGNDVLQAHGQSRWPEQTGAARQTRMSAQHEIQPSHSSQQPLSNRHDSRESSQSAVRATRYNLDRNAPEAYVSPARRRKPQPSPSPSALQESAVSIPQKSPLSTPSVQSKNPFQNIPSKGAQIAARPLPTRPKAPSRRIPPASSSAISSASQRRLKGTEAFKRGDFADAHAAYTNALQSLPESHPITIIIFCNRALTSLKNGDPKAAIADAESALLVIGVSRGEGEYIDLGHSEGQKDMKDFYGKALMRKAEALENMEKWTEAGKMWRDAVEAGVGGAISIQGRDRCEKASNTAARPATTSRPVVKPKLAVRKPAANNMASQEAVKKLRQANAAAERADDEKFALMDQVDAKLVAWKGTKADNLRALLGSLDKVLWQEAGWTKVGMADLVMANRVKIIYMKAIAKVHPDKISQAATTEQRMLSAAIFSTLNEAWDKFKQENNM